MRKRYQNEEIDTSQPAVPDTVRVALAELAGEMREGLLALAVGTGLQVMAAIMEEDVTAACGPRPDGARAGFQSGGRKIKRAPERGRPPTADGCRQAFAPTGVLRATTGRQ